MAIRFAHRNRPILLSWQPVWFEATTPAVTSLIRLVIGADDWSMFARTVLVCKTNSIIAQSPTQPPRTHSPQRESKRGPAPPSAPAAPPPVARLIGTIAARPR